MTSSSEFGGAASGRSTTWRATDDGGISGGGDVESAGCGPLGPRTNADERNLLAELDAAIAERR